MLQTGKRFAREALAVESFMFFVFLFSVSDKSLLFGAQLKVMV